MNKAIIIWPLGYSVNIKSAGWSAIRLPGYRVYEDQIRVSWAYLMICINISVRGISESNNTLIPISLRQFTYTF